MRAAFGRRVLLALGLGAVVLGLVAGPALAYPGAPWFKPSTVYTQNFPDPSVIRVGTTYYAYATPTGGAYLPVESSQDLVHWTARPAYNPGAPLNADPYFNDALPYPASWGWQRSTSSRMNEELWSPGVMRLGSSYLAYYAVRVAASIPRFCISVASASSPLGPFTDRTTGPLVCDADPAGSTDPQPYLDPSGHPWLLWKSEGVPGHTPTRLWSRQLAATGRGFLAGSSRHLLLQTARAWEGNVVEAPSMVRYAGVTWLFYSGNEWASSRYAIGYARCSGPAGPCTRVGTGPLLASSATRLGPGGETAFLDASGRLRLAHHYWNAPYTNYPAYPACLSSGTCTTQGQRRLAVELLVAGPAGTLRRG